MRRQERLPFPDEFPIGSIVKYVSPDWGPVQGRVLSEPFLRGRSRDVLCQDLSPNGAEEYWPIDELQPA